MVKRKDVPVLLTVAAVGLGVGKTAFQLRPKILRSLLQMFEVAAVHSFLRSTGHNLLFLRFRFAAPPCLRDRGSHPVHD